MRVVAMFRVSTEKQAAEGSSLPAQERIFAEFAAQKKWEVIATFKGTESATGASSDRKVLQQALECIRTHQVDAIWVIEQSRLTRGDEVEVAHLMRELRNRGMCILVRDTVRDLKSIEERMVVSLQGVIDRAESERIKERMTRGRRERGLKGKRVAGRPPFGYTTPPKGHPNHGTLQINPAQAAVVRRIWAMALNGMTRYQIASALTGQGVPGPRGRHWPPTTIARMLENPAYVGTNVAYGFVQRKGKRGHKLDINNPQALVVENAHEAIVSREDWDAYNHRPRIARTATPRMLTGLIRVNGLDYHSHGGPSDQRYGAVPGMSGRPRLPGPSTDAAVWDAFASLSTSDAFVTKLMEEAGSGRAQKVAADEVEHLERAEGKLRRRLATLLNMRADEEIDRPTYLAKSDEANRELKDVQAQLAKNRATAVSVDRTQAPRVVAAVRALVAGKARLTTAQRRSLLLTIVRKVELDVESAGPPRPLSDGTFGPREGPPWAIRRISFRLALDATRPVGAALEPATAAIEGKGSALDGDGGKQLDISPHSYVHYRVNITLHSSTTP